MATMIAPSHLDNFVSTYDYGRRLKTAESLALSEPFAKHGQKKQTASRSLVPVGCQDYIARGYVS